MDEQSPTLANFARHSPIPRKVLLYLHRQHLIQDPPCREDLLGLRLLEQVWGYRHAADTRLVNVHVQRLRSKIERDAESPSLVITVRGVGYRAGTGS